MIPVYDGLRGYDVVDPLTEDEILRRLPTHQQKELQALKAYKREDYSFYYDNKGSLNLAHFSKDLYMGLG